MAENILQTLVMPNFKFGAEVSMYTRLNDRVIPIFSENRILMCRGGKVSFDTFFNSITVGLWKKTTEIDNIMLRLFGEGKYIARFGLHHISKHHKWLDERIITIDPTNGFSINIDCWEEVDDGMLYLELEALEDGQVSGGYFYTEKSPKNDVKLGIVITHFNRKKFVVPAIKRMSDELLNDANFKNKIELFVVDNSQNITEEEASGATVIKNKNLGGSGGFTRGLLNLIDSNNFTHCLFMDDDASCEIESIRRAYVMLSHFTDTNLTISGSLMRDNEPHRLFEKGARFEGGCIPLKSGLDMLNVRDLLLSEIMDEKPSYGAWWFFAFPIKTVKYFPFPFFVRGDDIRFGLDNKFDIITMNGVGCWGEDFAVKSGPLSLYLDVRNHLITHLTTLNSSPLRIFQLTTRYVLGQLLSYNYASAEACVMAMRHVYSGPKFFEENIDMASVRTLINELQPPEKLVKADRTLFEPVHASVYDTRKRKLIRIITLNGFLLPDFFLKDKTLYQHKNFRGSLRDIFLYKKVYYEHEPTSTGYLATHDKSKFYSILFQYFNVSLGCWIATQKTRQQYLESWKDMTSQEFWRKIYN